MNFHKLLFSGNQSDFYFDEKIMPCVYPLSLWARYLPEFINILFQKQMSLTNSRQRYQRKTEGTKEAPIRFMTNLDHFESSIYETFMFSFMETLNLFVKFVCSSRESLT